MGKCQLKMFGSGHRNYNGTQPNQTQSIVDNRQLKAVTLVTVVGNYRGALGTLALYIAVAQDKSSMPDQQ